MRGRVLPSSGTSSLTYSAPRWPQLYNPLPSPTSSLITTWITASRFSEYEYNYILLGRLTTFLIGVHYNQFCTLPRFDAENQMNSAIIASMLTICTSIHPFCFIHCHRRSSLRLDPLPPLPIAPNTPQFTSYMATTFSFLQNSRSEPRS